MTQKNLSDFFVVTNKKQNAKNEQKFVSIKTVKSKKNDKPKSERKIYNYYASIIEGHEFIDEILHIKIIPSGGTSLISVPRSLIHPSGFLNEYLYKNGLEKPDENTVIPPFPFQKKNIKNIKK